MKEEILLKLIRNERLTEEEAAAADWNDVFREAQQQAVLSLVFANAEQYAEHIPEKDRVQWQQRHLAVFAQNMRAAEHQKKMIEIMSSGDDAYLVMKGMASAYYWPKPEQRAFGDCDFLIDPQDQAKLEKRFEDAGYQKSGGNGGHHVVFKNSDGADLEMHFSFNGIPSGSSGETVREYLKDALSSYEKNTVFGNAFRMPRPEHHGLILLLHMVSHMTSEGIGLRHLLDFGFFVTVTNGDPFWEDSLLPLLKKIGLFVFTKTIVKTCSLFCGTMCPAWADDIDNDLCDAVMADILVGGNFGFKDEDRYRQIKYIANRGEHTVDQKPTGIQLWNTIEKKAKVTGKSRLAVISDYVSMVLSGKRKLDNRKTIKRAAERKKLYAEFHLFETDNQ